MILNDLISPPINCARKAVNDFRLYFEMATLYLEVTSIPERMYLYLFPYNVSLGMYNKSN